MRVHLFDTVRFFKVNAFIASDHSICHQNNPSLKPPPASRHASPKVVKSGSRLTIWDIGVTIYIYLDLREY